MSAEPGVLTAELAIEGLTEMIINHTTGKPKPKNLGQQLTNPELRVGNRTFVFLFHVFASIFPNFSA